MQAIHLYSLADGKTTQVTDGMSDAESPAFDKNGKYLYFTASTNSGAAMEPDIQSFARPVTASVYVVVLSKTEPSPLEPESDEEKKPEVKKDEPKKDEAKKDEASKGDAKKDDKDKDKDKSAEKVEVKVDLENIGQRILPLPMPARRYIGLVAGKAGVVYVAEGPAPGTPGPFTVTIHRFDLNKRKTDTVLSGVRRLASIVHRRETALPAGRQVDHCRRAGAALGHRRCASTQTGEREDAENR